ncbi:uncharacterized protein LOC131076584 [Cryptomeria japonica]|uniref:uncharacterized protein LOC131076584 n=1 Tax=Cryptomeria japonica TaxID=3369 RepID=UPI0025ACF2E0|nr:uncharacterized protein LOC131076584 [Cryptomeria japonica]
MPVTEQRAAWSAPVNGFTTISGVAYGVGSGRSSRRAINRPTLKPRVLPRYQLNWHTVCMFGSFYIAVLLSSLQPKIHVYVYFNTLMLCMCIFFMCLGYLCSCLTHIFLR